ncbi:ribonuclease P/MRP protein subunit POP1 [Aspergillus neoniger CBS 115656]|uniref:Ribonuclease P complex subunit Pop1 n=1 Tax=Aspergillus neoniger (strain CBS 115656) TaxID=1448310 RepID=A0A318YI03_ASPNB|nr:ribonuclease P complex subunit Pop1 [Aspergillus neoniger CBS 115656]PYH34065.1 ribonuclease P complex subunit Pop1 [Aspergillus neoniger CBS 115656]
MASHPPKRKPAAPNFSAAAARKRQKTFDARSLAVQVADAALSASGELDVAAYVEAREYEIRSLESGIQRSKNALTSRAFQKVPRSLRRRTASHNVKRVPKRLRARARREMIEDNTPTVSSRTRKPTEQMRIRLETARRLQNLNAKTKAKRAAVKAQRDKEARKSLEESGSHAYEIAPRVPKIKKNKLSRPNPPEARFKKRQQCKTWLPTHMFHAKRAHMATSKDPLWRFAVPLSPTEKSYRPTHRARGSRGAVAWDMSYLATVQLEGSVGAIEGVLRAVGVEGEKAWGVKGRKWRAGTRGLRTLVYEWEGEKRPIAPVTLVWCAEVKGEDVEMVDADESGKQKKGKKGWRKVFVRVHPSAFLQLWDALLGVSKKQNPPVMVEDLRFEIGSIEITGPGATEALLASFKPVSVDGKDFAADSPEATWTSLLGVTNPASLPQDAVLGFSVSDPRLDFPPKTLKPSSSEEEMQRLAILLSSWSPDNTQTAPALFDRRARLAAARQLPSQKAINRRRTEAGPGVRPPAKDTDPKIPVMVLASRPTHSKSSSAPGTWTVLLPWKCVLPFWYSLMYYPLSSGGNPRFGGLKEQQQLSFESGEPWFPGDFPGTRAGWEWGLRERSEAKREWERRPKGRRTEFESIDLRNGQKGEIGRGWACDWERLVQGAAPEASKTTDKEQPSETESKPDDTTNPQDNDANATLPPLSIYQLSTSEATRALTDPSTTTTINASALATVKLTLLNRGTPSPRARIYRLPTTDRELRQDWLTLSSKQPYDGLRNELQKKQSRSTANLGPEDVQQQLAATLITPSAGDDVRQKHLPVPTEEDLIGFVTTGNYNLAEGKGTGIGSVLLSKVQKGKASGKNMCIIRSAGETVARVGFWELV